VWNHKFASWRNIDLWVVTISEWLANCARQSQLFAETPIDVIPNGVDVARFAPRARCEARARLGMAPDRKYVVFGALGALTDERKGFKQLVEAMHTLETLPDAANTELVVFGNPDEAAMPSLGIPTRFEGMIDDDQRLADLYAAADVMVAPSLQEAFGKTLVESMACGTPVVAFRAGGPAEIIDHQVNGYLASPFEPEDLARGIAWCIASAGRSAALGRAARRKVEENYNAALVGQRYLEHYRRILARPA
jgi:glycosyltransferase involved in cell wall biosynthesis